MLIDEGLRSSLDRAIAKRIERLKQRQIRSMERFAEEEIVIPSGRFEGARFSCSRQPFTRHWFRLVDSGKWKNMFATGPVQASKTLCASTIPVMYHLFEIGETVVYAVPSGDMAGDKWKIDILPVIERSRYAELLPDRGAGSKGGDKVVTIKFKNGASLRFMGAGGSDDTRAGFTTRVVVMTEMDKFQDRSKTSKESNPYTQVRDRLQSYGEDAIFYGETTVSTAEGLVWSQWKHGTGTCCYIPCPHCGEYVRPEREDFRGWQHAKTIFEAKRDAKIYCPKCGEAWSEEERREANEQSIPIHRGQSVEDGVVVGKPPETDSLSFRWTCVDNHMSTMSVVAGVEWDGLFGAGSENPDNAELMIRQKYWVIPPDPEELSQPAAFKPFSLIKRLGDRLSKSPHDKGVVPAWTECLTAGVDCRKRFLHFVVHAWGDNARSQIIDYGVEEVQHDLYGPEQSIYNAIISLAESLTEGYRDEFDELEFISKVFIDAGYQKNSVVKACLEMKRRQEDKDAAPGLYFQNRIYWPILGFGLSTDERNRYVRPRQLGPSVLKIGLDSYLGRINEKGVWQTVYHLDVDRWKTDVRNRLASSKDDPSAMTFYWTEEETDHLALAKHLCAETPHREFVEDKGFVDTWLRKNRNNHYLDATTYSRAASWWNGIRLPVEKPVEETSSNSNSESRRNGSTNGIHIPSQEETTAITQEIQQLASRYRRNL